MNLPSPTYCDECDHRYMVGKTDPPWRWLCMKYKPHPSYGFVASRPWEGMAPYARCQEANSDGNCRHWIPARKPGDRQESGMTDDTAP